MEGLFWGLAIVGTTLFVVKMVLLLVGGDASDGDFGEVDFGDAGDLGDGGGLDLDPAAHGPAGEIAGSGTSVAAFTFFSIQSLATFAMGAGWGGLFFKANFDVTYAEAGLLAAGCGVFCAWLLLWLLGKARGLEQRGNLDPRRAIGQGGTVYLAIPVNGHGQVQVEVQGRLATLGARAPEQALPTGADVVVTAVDRDGTLVVRPRSS